MTTKRVIAPTLVRNSYKVKPRSPWSFAAITGRLLGEREHDEDTRQPVLPRPEQLELIETKTEVAR